MAAPSWPAVPSRPPLRPPLRPPSRPPPRPWVALLVQRYLSNTASLVFNGITCLIRLIQFATSITTFEESVCYTSSVRQVVPPEGRRPGRRRRRRPRRPAQRAATRLRRESVGRLAAAARLLARRVSGSRLSDGSFAPRSLGARLSNGSFAPCVGSNRSRSLVRKAALLRERRLARSRLVHPRRKAL